MNFTIDRSLEILSRTPAVLNTLLRDISADWSSQNEGGETWSPYDIVGHLIHGEKTDWIPRATLILSDNPDKSFIPFNRFAQFEESQGKTLNQLLDEFARLRKEGIEQLRSMNITDSQLQDTGIHPKFNKVTLQQLLSTWVVHDLNHIAQVTRVMAFQYKEAVGPWTEFLKILQ
jgi:uncharacterized damage-inducible protein DinB